MSVKLKIKVTKEILEKSKMCPSAGAIAIHNCAVALAVRDIFPKARVYNSRFCPFPDSDYSKGIPMPYNARQFITLFDNTHNDFRPSLPELEFEIEIPDEVIQQINIEELRPLLINHPTLELV